jgi:Uma2 family endonuclease
MSPTGWEHNHLAYRISKIVGDYVDSHQLGEVCTGEAGFILHQQPDTVLGADVAFVQAQRLVNVDRTGFLPFAPDLAVEIASPSQFKPEMNAKAQELLEAGTRLVWVVWPKTKHIDVWRPNVPMLTRAATDSVEGYDVIPGFQYSVGNMFT